MSWQGVVDEVLANFCQLSKLSIHGLDGTIYAASNEFEVQATEACNIVKGIMKDPSLFYRGVTVERNQYNYVCCEPGYSLICRCGKVGVIAVRTQRCILIGKCTNIHQEAYCYRALDKIGEHFRSQGY